MTALTATFLLVGAFALFAAAVWVTEKAILWWAAGRRRDGDFLPDRNGHVKRLP